MQLEFTYNQDTGICHVCTLNRLDDGTVQAVKLQSAKDAKETLTYLLHDIANTYEKLYLIEHATLLRETIKTLGEY